jgi:hypothetical protein
MKKSAIIHVTTKTHAAASKYAAEKGVTIGEAVDLLVAYANKRRAALKRYQKAQA